MPRMLRPTRAPSPRRWLRLGLIGLVCGLGVTALHFHVEPYRKREWSVRDELTIEGRRAALHPDIVLLAIDSASTTLDEIPKGSGEIEQSPALQLMAQGWPWPRETYGLIIERLAAAGARVIALDMMFPTEREGDGRFRAALERFRDKVVLGSNLVETESETGDKDPIVAPAASLIPTETGPYDPRVGFVNVRPDTDGKVRRMTFRTSLLEQKGLPPMAGAPEIFSLSARIIQRAGLDARLPRDHEPRLLRFVTAPPRSLHEIFIPAHWDSPRYRSGEFFRDKIVLIGPIGNWAKDVLDSPFGPFPGPQMHVSAVNAVLTNDFLRESSPALNLALIAGGVVVALGLGAVPRQFLRLALLLAALAIYAGAALALFNSTGLMLILLSPAVALLSTGSGCFILDQIVTQRDRARIRRTMARYLSKDLTTELLDNRESFLHTLGGVRKELTVLFSDVRDFTTITEAARDPAQLVTQLNEYFGEMVRLVFEQRGRLDKFIGDAVMAEWGGLLTGGAETDARRAVATALAMREALVRLNAGWLPRGMSELRIGIGINHGDAIVGNLGSEEKMEVSVIGDAVNLASRLEGATKQFQLDLLIGETVAPLVREAFLLRTVDLLQVKGKTKPVEVFTVVGARVEGTAVPAWLEDYEHGVRSYRERAFAEAAARFETAAAGQPDWLTGEYLRRCRHYVANPPGAAWDGVHVMAEK